jgi:hypothetical protein
MTVLSDKYGFTYIRVPRTSSTTFVHYLTKTFPDCEQPAGYQHASAGRVLEWFDDRPAFVHIFGFIRDPWDWLVSMYNGNITAGACDVQPKGTKGARIVLSEPMPGSLAEPWDAPYLEHVDQRLNKTFPEWVHERQTTPMDWLTDDKGVLLVDEIRRKEDFVDGIPTVLSAAPVKPRRPYRKWYDQDLAAYVAEKCHREIEIGGYVF